MDTTSKVADLAYSLLDATSKMALISGEFTLTKYETDDSGAYLHTESARWQNKDGATIALSYFRPKDKEAAVQAASAVLR